MLSTNGKVFSVLVKRASEKMTTKKNKTRGIRHFDIPSKNIKGKTRASDPESLESFVIIDDESEEFIIPSEFVRLTLIYNAKRLQHRLHGEVFKKEGENGEEKFGSSLSAKSLEKVESQVPTKAVRKVEKSL